MSEKCVCGHSEDKHTRVGDACSVKGCNCLGFEWDVYDLEEFDDDDDDDDDDTLWIENADD